MSETFLEMDQFLYKYIKLNYYCGISLTSKIAPN